MKAETNTRRTIYFVNRFYYPDTSATSQILSDLAPRLTQEDDVVVVTTRQLYTDSAASLPAFARHERVTIVRVAGTQYGRSSLLGRALDYASFYYSSFVHLVRNISRVDVVVLKTDPPLLSLMGPLLKLFKGAKVVNWCQDVYPEVAAVMDLPRIAFAVLWPLRIARDLSLRLAHCNVAIGNKMKATLVDRGIDSNSIVVIPNWSIVPSQSSKTTADEDLRSQWHLKDYFVVGYSGNLGRAHSTLEIEAAICCYHSRDDMAFLFIGGGIGMSRLKRFADHKNVIFKGYQPRETLSDSLAVPDVHIVSLDPRLEGYIVPSKIYGILEVGRPILFIGSTSGEVAELLTSNRCGITVEWGDATAFARQLALLRDNPAMLREMSTNARELYLSSFHKDLAYKSWKQVLA